MTHAKLLLFVTLSSLVLIGCTRGVTSTSVDGAPSNLNSWIDGIKNKPASGERAPLPLLLEQEIFSYADHMTVSIDPNPSSALERAGQAPSFNPSLTISSYPDSTAVGFDSLDADLFSEDLLPESTLQGSLVQIPESDLLARSAPTTGLLRSPFDLPLAVQEPERVSASTLRPDPNRPKQALEAYPLDSLSMVGTFGAGSQIMALIMAPDKVVYRIGAGQYLGQQDGRIVQINEGSVSLVELVEDGAGGWVEKDSGLVLVD